KGTLLLQEGQGYQILPEKVRTQELAALSPLHRKEDAEQGKAARAALEPASAKGKAETTYHAPNFLDSLKSGTAPNGPVAAGHRAASATLLAKIALRRGRYLQGDAKAERVVNDEEANRLLAYEYRAPWKLT